MDHGEEWGSDVLESLIERAAKGLSFDDAARELKERRLPIVKAMKILMEVYDIGLSEVKRRVSQHPAWQEDVEAARPLHDDLEALSNKSD